jgi:hypothetical protein
MNKNREELFALNTSLHIEADKMLKETGLGKIISEAGYKPVGSYVMQTMTWRDLDFERSENPPDWQRHWEFGMKLAQTGWVWKFSCVNEYHHRRDIVPDAGLYWGLQFDYPKDGPIWKIDLWTARPEEWVHLAERAEWMSKLTHEARFHILAIKDAVWDSPDYRKTLLSVHIYEAVLEHNIRTLEEFREWWQARYRK